MGVNWILLVILCIIAGVIFFYIWRHFHLLSAGDGVNPASWGHNYYRVADKIWKVLPECCELCIKHAQQEVRLFEMAKHAGLVRAVRHFRQDHHPLASVVGKTPYSYLIMEMESILPLWDLHGITLKAVDLDRLQQDIQDLQDANIYVDHLGLDNVAWSVNRDRLVVLTTSATPTKKDPFNSKGSIILYLELSMFESLAEYNQYKKWVQKMTLSH